MKSLNEFINECYDKGLDYGSRRSNQMNDFIDFFGDDINDVLLEKYMADETFDYILETLNANDSNKVSKGDLSEYHNVCYHFTDINNVDSILKNGLRRIHQTGQKFPDRIYLYATTDKITEENLSDFIKKITNSHDIGVLKINFNKIKSYSIYRDSAMREENTFFTYTSIPSKCISFVKELKL